MTFFIDNAPTASELIDDAVTQFTKIRQQLNEAIIMHKEQVEANDELIAQLNDDTNARLSEIKKAAKLDSFLANAVDVE